MLPTDDDSRKTYDVCVVGAGLNGLAAANALADLGFEVASLGALEAGGHGRTVALFGRSLALIETLGLKDQLESRAAPLRTLRIVDVTRSLFAAAPIEFRSTEIGLDAFGWNVENAILSDLLSQRLAAAPMARRFEGRLARLDWRSDQVLARLESGDAISSRVVVGADGRGSPTRALAGLTTRQREYRQSALTLFLRHERPHDDVSTEFHTREGPFTLVPLPASPQSANRSSLVWLMSEPQAGRRGALDDDALGREIEKQSHGLLGAVEIEGARGLFPMVGLNASSMIARRVALVGDAAHVFPPIGAQGLNLGFRDIAGLTAALASSRNKGHDIGDAATLRTYAAARAPDVAARSLVVNGLNASLIANAAPLDVLRSLGLAALRRLPPLRRFAMREGLESLLAR